MTTKKSPSDIEQIKAIIAKLKHPWEHADTTDSHLDQLLELANQMQATIDEHSRKIETIKMTAFNLDAPAQLMMNAIKLIIDPTPSKDSP